MIEMGGTAIVAAENRSDNFTVYCDSEGAKTRVPIEEQRDCLLIIGLSKTESINRRPKRERVRDVISDELTNGYCWHISHAMLSVQ